MPQSLSMHWLEIVVTAVCGLNVALVTYLIKKSSDQSEHFKDSLEKISASIPTQLDKAILKFDTLCKERQLACSGQQGNKVDNMCTRLNTYAFNSDKRWNELTRRREDAWTMHKEEMSRIWSAIHNHSHTEEGKVIR